MQRGPAGAGRDATCDLHPAHATLSELALLQGKGRVGRVGPWVRGSEARSAPRPQSTQPRARQTRTGTKNSHRGWGDRDSEERTARWTAIYYWTAATVSARRQRTATSLNRQLTMQVGLHTKKQPFVSQVNDGEVPN